MTEKYYKGIPIEKIENKKVIGGAPIEGINPEVFRDINEKFLKGEAKFATYTRKKGVEFNRLG